MFVNLAVNAHPGFKSCALFKIQYSITEWSVKYYNNVIPQIVTGKRHCGRTHTDLTLLK